MHARGTADEPIVFTSAKPEGSRAGGDWGGVVLLGNAPINRGQANVEGIPTSDGRGVFGGGDPRSNCGVLEYVRVEFAGYAIGTDNELNGLTFGGCGSETLVRHVQVHRAHDDGIEIFGGAVDLKYVLVSHAGDDALDWDMGWTGRARFLIVQQHPELGGSGFEGDNWSDDPDAEPVSRPRIYNVTMVGSGRSGRTQRAMVIRNGSGGEFRNFLITGFPLESIDFRGELTADRIASKTLSFGSIAMSTTGADGRTYFADESGARDDDGGFDERRYFSDLAPDILLDAPEALGPDARSLTAPDFTPVAAYIGAGSQWSPPLNEEFWDEAAIDTTSVGRHEPAIAVSTAPKTCRRFTPADAGRISVVRRLGAAGALLAVPALAFADELDSGDTAWMLTATALVLFMTIPGLSLFYAGMVRSKNVLSMFMQCFAIAGLVSILWAVYAYSLAFDEGNPFIGGLAKAFLSGVTVDAMSGTIPETVFVAYQMAFAIITPALIVGAFAERMKFSAMLLFMVLWLTLCHAPVCHWVWGGGWLGELGILDYSGGTVVHINAGIAGLAAVLVIIDSTMGLRVTGEQEEEGLDPALHDERGYML